MTAPSLLDELEDVVRLAEKATPGEWKYFPKKKYNEHHVSVPSEASSFHIGLFPNGCPTDRPAADAELMAAAVNFIRTHHAEIAQAVSNSVPVSQLVELLPGTYYMDPPDGGDVSVMEQLRRDARRYRWLRISAFEIAWNEWCSYSPGYAANGPEELDSAIDNAMHNSAQEVAE